MHTGTDPAMQSRNMLPNKTRLMTRTINEETYARVLKPLNWKPKKASSDARFDAIEYDWYRFQRNLPMIRERLCRSCVRIVHRQIAAVDFQPIGLVGPQIPDR